jgi:lysophospholipase L1-like esterase
MNGIKIILSLIILSGGSNLCGQNSAQPHQDRKNEAPSQPKLSTITPVPSKLKKFMPSRHNQKLEEAKKGDFDVVMIGDSITHTWDSQKDFKKIFEKVRVLNLGFAGDRTQNVLWRIQNGALENVSPKLVTLMIGTNHLHNVRKNHQPDETADILVGIQEVIKEIQTRLPDAKIIVFSVFPRKNPTENGRVKALNKELPKVADNRQIFHEDINKVFLDQSGEISKNLYLRDGLHLTEKGYAAWGKALLPILKKYGL